MSKWKRGQGYPTSTGDATTNSLFDMHKSMDEWTVFSGQYTFDNGESRIFVAQLNRLAPDYISNRAIIECAPEAIALLRSISKMEPHGDASAINEAYAFISSLDKKIKK